MPDIYPHPSLRFVAFEVRFPPVLEFTEDPWLRELDSALRHEYPYRESFSVVQSVELGPDGVHQDVSRRTRFTSRTRSSAMSLGRDLLVFETGRYGSFEAFRASVAAAIEAVSARSEIAGFERIGLRYVNELRIDPAPTRPAEWKRYLAAHVVSPMCLLLPDRTAETFEAALRYPGADGTQVLFRFGARTGRAVNPTGPVRLEDTGDGPFFLLDIDSFWEHSPTELPEFDTEEILTHTDELHEAAQDVFEASITDRLRTEVFGGEGRITR